MVFMSHTSTNTCITEGDLEFYCKFWFTQVLTHLSENNSEGAPSCKKNKTKQKEKEEYALQQGN